MPSPLVRDFAASRDEVVASTLAAIHQELPPRDSTHSLPAGDGGASLTSLARHAFGNYLGAFYILVGPLQQRLTVVGGRASRLMASMLVDLASFRESQQ